MPRLKAEKVTGYHRQVFWYFQLSCQAKGLASQRAPPRLNTSVIVSTNSHSSKASLIKVLELQDVLPGCQVTFHRQFHWSSQESKGGKFGFIASTCSPMHFARKAEGNWDSYFSLPSAYMMELFPSKPQYVPFCYNHEALSSSF
jgi:hypothetical protein